MLLLCSCSKQEQNSINNEQLWPESLMIKSLDISDQSLEIINNNAGSKQWLLINVWATWCAPCRKEMPLLQQLSEELSDLPISIKLLSIDNDINLIKEFVLQNNIHLPVYFTKQESIEKMLNISAYPMTFLISPNGKVIKSFLGVRAWSSKEMRLQLETLLKEA
tara:strand:- start:23223 stop:23714 length:492 start_codon:yes stop_codon:yes gene_type:complete